MGTPFALLPANGVPLTHGEEEEAQGPHQVAGAAAQVRRAANRRQDRPRGLRALEPQGRRPQAAGTRGQEEAEEEAPWLNPCCDYSSAGRLPSLSPYLRR